MRWVSFAGTTAIPCRNAQTANAIGAALGEPPWHQPYQDGDRFFVLVDNFTAEGDQRMQDQLKGLRLRHWVTFPECVITWKALAEKLQAEMGAGRLPCNELSGAMSGKSSGKKPWAPLIPRL